MAIPYESLETWRNLLQQVDMLYIEMSQATLDSIKEGGKVTVTNDPLSMFTGTPITIDDDLPLGEVQVRVMKGYKPSSKDKLKKNK